jgi:hypothetical protein
MELKKLYFVEFGDPDFTASYNWDSKPHCPMFVVAKDYNEAASKALVFIEYEPKPIRKIINLDGDLNPIEEREIKEIKIKAVKLASENVIW